MILRAMQSGLLLLLIGAPASADDKTLQTFIENNCAGCHNKDEKKGNLDFAALSTDFSDKAVFNRWVKVHDRIKAGEMPPKKHLETKETAPALESLAAGLVKAERDRTGNDRAAYRRLTRSEYEFTIRDLFSLPGMPLKDDLPADGSAYGFNKVSEALDTSHLHMVAYMDAAKRVLEQATAPWPSAPKTFKKRIYPVESEDSTAGLVGGSYVLLKDKKRDPSFPLPNDKHLSNDKIHYYIDTIFKVNQNALGMLRRGSNRFQQSFQPILAGRYKFRVSLWSFWWDQGEVKPSKKTQVASLRSNRGENLYFDAPSLESKAYEFELWLEAGDFMRFDAASLEYVDVNSLPGHAKKYQGPGIAIDWLDVEGPIYDSWPPPSRLQLFGNLPLEQVAKAKDTDKKSPPAPTRRGLVQRTSFPRMQDYGFADGVWTVNPAAPLTEAKALLKQFLPNAFRRPVNEPQTARYLNIVEDELKAGACFEEAMRSAYQAALCSPEFLFHIEPSGLLDDWTVASRLSYFLWNSAPDEVLIDLAKRGELKKGGDGLKNQVRRMLQDPRADRFIEDFLGQWLSLHEIDANFPDNYLYPEFIPYMQDCMVGETHAFFRHLLLYNLGIKNLVDSDFAMLNGELGKLYGIADVPEGHRYWNFLLPPDSHRGGLLTQASILKVTANGTTTSPVKRGAWVMDRLLGKRPDPPPPNITGLEPDVRGATTIREQLALHRNSATCAACHRNIDPPGFALESYDVIGQWRDRYRAKDKGKQTKTKSGEEHYANKYRSGLPVDCSGEMADGVVFKNIDDMKKLLLKDERQLARNYLQRLIIYATGKEAGFADRQAVEKILDKCGKVDNSELTNFGAFRMRSLIEELVVSELFLSK